MLEGSSDVGVRGIVLEVHGGKLGELELRDVWDIWAGLRDDVHHFSVNVRRGA